MIKSTLYAKYIKEREGFEVLENEFSFLTYVINPNKECFIGHLYVDSKLREQGNCRNIINGLKIVAKKRGCNNIVASIDLRDKNASHTILCALQIGFKILSANNNLIVISLDNLGGD
jgi:hypothetical protein